MNRYVADLHIHSHYSRATSKDLDLEHLAQWAQLKGVQVVATGDIAHPGWLAELQAKLEPAEDGLFRLKAEVIAPIQAQVPTVCQAEVRFLLGGEISNIYKRHDQVRKVHNLCFFPSFAAVERFQSRLERIGNIRADGRPILRLDSRDLLEITLETDDQGYFIPAHIWTPWFAMFGSKSGFNTVEECFGDLTDQIFAVETGLSADPPMCWRVSDLDRYTLVSNSDAHSPPKLAREASVFQTAYSYHALFGALKSGDPDQYLGTLEFFPEEGKYHFDGHRKCEVRWHPQTSIAHGDRCPVCGKGVTVGVMHRVEALADRAEGEKPARTHPYRNIIPLPELLAEVEGAGAASKRVQSAYRELLGKLGNELHVLLDAPLAAIEKAHTPLLAEAVRRIREGEVQIAGGYDGEYGVIQIFAPGEKAGLAAPQLGLFEASDEITEGAEDRASTEDTESTEAVENIESVGRGVALLAEQQMEKPAQSDLGSAVALEAVQAITPSPVQPSPSLREELLNYQWRTAPAQQAPNYQSPNLLLAPLNQKQRAAAECTDHSVIIVAGPGTGKTRTLTVRMAHLIGAHGVAPEAMLAITFTNKAAEEMRERLTGLLGESTATRLTIKTFHALGAQILKEAGEALGISPTFAIASEADQRTLLKGIVPDASEQLLTTLLDQISTAKDELLAPDDPTLPQRFPEPANFAEIYGRYAAGLRANRLLDFGDLIYQTVRLLESQPALLQRYQDRYRWVAVDEYQDSNYAQYRLLRLLTPTGTNLCAIGDPDQAIYGFRGAKREYFLRFQEDFPAAKVLELDQNYRSTQTILEAAVQVIAEGTDRAAALQIWSDFVDQTKLQIYQAPTDKAEAEYVVHQIEQMVGGTSYFSLDTGRASGVEERVRGFGDFAVLYRTSAQSRLLIEAFERSGIPYQTVGQTPLVEYKEIRQILAYLWLALNPTATFYQEQVYANARRKDLARIGYFLPKLQAMQGVNAVADLIDRVAEFLRIDLEEKPTEAQQERIARLRRRSISFGTGLHEFLQATLLQHETDHYDPRADRVTLMTLHAAKGLEFGVVFIVGCEESLLPYTLAGRTSDREEERRLFYVGMTRAQQRLILLHAKRRVLYGQRMENEPSRFLDDIEATLKELQALAGRKLKKEAPAELQLSLFG